MAYGYWDYGTSTSSTGNHLTHWYSCDNSVTSNYISWGTTWLRRRILVTPPGHWTQDDVMAFVELVNVKTRTGWLVTIVIKGDVIITDPNIETRTMEEFIPLLRWRASRDDNAKIDMFFNKHLLKEPTPADN